MCYQVLKACWFLQSYLELISLYKDLLARKREELRLDKERLENGVTKIAQASAQVSHACHHSDYKPVAESKLLANLCNVGQECPAGSSVV